MQLSEIKTVEQAKALAFDAIQRIEIEQNNLRALQARIQELQNAEVAKKTDKQLELLQTERWLLLQESGVFGQERTLAYNISMLSVTNPRPVAKVSHQAVIPTGHRSIIGTAKSSNPPRVTLRNTIISATSKINITRAKVLTSKIVLTSKSGLSQDAINTALCDDPLALCDDATILAGQYVDYSERPITTQSPKPRNMHVTNLKVVGAING